MAGHDRPIPDDVAQWLKLFELSLRHREHALLDSLAGILLESILEDRGIDRRLGNGPAFKVVG